MIPNVANPPATVARTRRVGTGVARPFRRLASFAAALVFGWIPAQRTVAATVDYQRDVRPILERRCFSCHSRLQQKGGLRLDAGVLILKGGKDGPAIARGDAAHSPLIARLLAADDSERMPPEGKPLPADQIAVLRAWIDAGATFPADEIVPSSPADHWAFQIVKRPAIPPVKGIEWTRNPVDRFVLSRLEAARVTPSGPPEPMRLLRRMYLDLLGMPPTLAEQEAFEARLKATDANRALDEVLDALLLRPEYGERWARHWLDLVRYADSNGYERDAAKPFVWRYRDWVIRALNDDLPYDRFVMAQLAGDEMPEATGETLIASGMLRLGHWDDEPADPDTDRYDQLDDIVGTVSQVFLGLTLGCARCHDHKFEPLSTRDYYSMVAVFNPLERPRDGRTELTRPVGSPSELAALAARERRARELTDEAARVRARARETWLATDGSRLAPEILAAFRTSAAQRNESQRKLVAEHTAALDAELAGQAAVKAELQRLDAIGRELASIKASDPGLVQGYFMFEPGPKPPATHVLIRGNPHRHGAEVGPAVPAVVASNQPRFPEASDRTSRRRTGLAQWIASPDNPLTARVIVNRVWQQHFGAGLVRTPSDFGLMGELPTHPELLDWLADWFTHEGGWSLKRLHRLLLGSAAWRQGRAGPAEADPENRLLSHLPHRRLEAEAIRDSVLAASGRLNPKRYGPAMFPAIPEAAVEANTDRQSVWKPSDETEASRRTIYAFIKRGLVVPMLEVFDLCDTVNSTSRRPVTTVAPQALTLFNGDFVNQQARHFADRLEREAGANAVRQIELAYRLALARRPTAAESGAMQRYLVEESARFRTESTQSANGSGVADAAARHARTQLCRVVLNLNEFVYPD